MGCKQAAMSSSTRASGEEYEWTDNTETLANNTTGFSKATYEFPSVNCHKQTRNQTNNTCSSTAPTTVPCARRPKNRRLASKLKQVTPENPPETRSEFSISSEVDEEHSRPPNMTSRDNYESLLLELAPFAVVPVQKRTDRDFLQGLLREGPSKDVQNIFIRTFVREDKPKHADNGMCHPIFRKKSPVTSANARCQLCHKNNGKELAELRCGHFYHNECIEDKPLCPLCGALVEDSFVS